MIRALAYGRMRDHIYCLTQGSIKLRKHGQRGDEGAMAASGANTDDTMKLLICLNNVNS